MYNKITLKGPAVGCGIICDVARPLSRIAAIYPIHIFKACLAAIAHLEATCAFWLNTVQAFILECSSTHKLLCLGSLRSSWLAPDMQPCPQALHGSLPQLLLRSSSTALLWPRRLCILLACWLCVHCAQGGCPQGLRRLDSRKAQPRTRHCSQYLLALTVGRM